MTTDSCLLGVFVNQHQLLDTPMSWIQLVFRTSHASSSVYLPDVVIFLPSFQLTCYLVELERTLVIKQSEDVNNGRAQIEDQLFDIFDILSIFISGVAKSDKETKRKQTQLTNDNPDSPQPIKTVEMFQKYKSGYSGIPPKNSVDRNGNLYKLLKYLMSIQQIAIKNYMRLINLSQIIIQQYKLNC